MADAVARLIITVLCAVALNLGWAKNSGKPRLAQLIP